MKAERQFIGNSTYRSRLVDGHFHTELCPHGSGDRTALMIEKAIELRIEKVCLTEHAPLPKAFEAEYGGDKIAYDTASLKLNQVDSYLELGRELQRAYGTHIDISLGFEVDYIPGFESDIQDFLDRYGPLTDDNIYLFTLWMA
jgi:putative histidinol-phosphatase